MSFKYGVCLINKLKHGTRNINTIHKVYLEIYLKGDAKLEYISNWYIRIFFKLTLGTLVIQYIFKKVNAFKKV